MASISSANLGLRSPHRHQSADHRAARREPVAPPSSDLSETARFAPPHTPRVPAVPGRQPICWHSANPSIVPPPATLPPSPESSPAHSRPASAGRTTPRHPLSEPLLRHSPPHAAPSKSPPQSHPALPAIPDSPRLVRETPLAASP